MSYWQSGINHNEDMHDLCKTKTHGNEIYTRKSDRKTTWQKCNSSG